MMDSEEQEKSLKGLEQIAKHPTNGNPQTLILMTGYLEISEKDFVQS